MIQSVLTRYLDQPTRKLITKKTTSPLDNWFYRYGINPLRYENLMPMSSILGRNDVERSVEAFNKGFSDVGKKN